MAGREEENSWRAVSEGRSGRQLFCHGEPGLAVRQAKSRKETIGD